MCFHCPFCNKDEYDGVAGELVLCMKHIELEALDVRICSETIHDLKVASLVYHKDSHLPRSPTEMERPMDMGL